jgi:enoyl-CoA hydratase
MPYKTIICETKGHVAYLTLNRSEANNAISQQLAHELQEACSKVNQDEKIYAVIITGADDTFCCGSELEGRFGSKGDPIDFDQFRALRSNFSVATPVARIMKPVIAAINGCAAGQGLELALSCDIRVASCEAKFCLPQVQEGLIPLDGGTQRLPRLIGRSMALELMLTGKTIDASEALKVGLVNHIASSGDLMQKAEGIAKDIATKGPLAVKLAKEAVYRGLDMPLIEALQLEVDLYSLLQTTSDREEGIKAFLEKRRPDFKGQ